MILEGLVTTVNEDGTANVSPMGPLVDREISRLLFRPYQTSRTYRNLQRNRKGVFHVTDDVLMLARAAVGGLDPPPELRQEHGVEGFVLAGACRWYAFQVTELDDHEERTRIETRIYAEGRLRDFFGLNRAKHAVVEAAILATRIKFLPAEQILKELDRLQILIEKTAGDQEEEAFAFLREYVAARTEGG